MNIFTNDSKILDLYEFQKGNSYTKIIDILNECLHLDLIKPVSKSQFLACAIARNDHKLEEHLLNMPQFGLMELLKACFILDTKRYINQLEKRLIVLNKQKKINPKKITYVEKYINSNKGKDQGMCDVPGFKLNGAKLRRIKKWIRTIPEDKLEIWAISMPKNQWKRLADILHLSKKDFQLPWFLDHIFENKIDETEISKNSLVLKIDKLETSEELYTIIQDHHLPYSAIRTIQKTKKIELTDETKLLISTYSSLETILWFWEELQCDNVNNSILKRIKTEDHCLSYGKLMERLMSIRSYDVNNVYFGLMPFAEKELQKNSVEFGKKVVVIGDASASMQVAIRTSCIIASLLCVMCKADLRFFNTKDIKVEPPKNVQEVIQMGNEIQANCATAPAVSLVPYYESKEHIDTFIIVTDEEENTGYNGQYGDKSKGYMFADVMKKYIEEINPETNIIFISFKQNFGNEYGYYQDADMTVDLKNKIQGIEERMFVFKMGADRPDLTKLNKIIYFLTPFNI